MQETSAPTSSFLIDSSRLPARFSEPEQNWVTERLDFPALCFLPLWAERCRWSASPSSASSGPSPPDVCLPQTPPASPGRRLKPTQDGSEPLQRDYRRFGWGLGQDTGCWSFQECLNDRFHLKPGTDKRGWSCFFKQLDLFSAEKMGVRPETNSCGWEQLHSSGFYT